MKINKLQRLSDSICDKYGVQRVFIAIDNNPESANYSVDYRLIILGQNVIDEKVKAREYFSDIWAETLLRHYGYTGYMTNKVILYLTLLHELGHHICYEKNKTFKNKYVLPIIEVESEEDYRMLPREQVADQFSVAEFLELKSEGII